MSDLADQIAALTPEQRQLFALRLRQKNPLLLKLQPIPRRTGDGPWPLSYEQERLWFVQALFPAGAAFNIANDHRFRDPLDVPALRAALAEVVRRHEILRTRFLAPDGHPFQVVQPAAPPALPLVDLSALPAGLRASEEHRRAVQQARLPFHLAAEDPLRLTLLRLTPTEHLLLITFHHIATDWWSSNVFLNEVSSLYRDLSQGRRPTLPEPPIQYADFAAWQRSWLPFEVTERDLVSRWRERLAGAPLEIDLPTDRPRPAVATFQGARLSFLLSPETAGRLRTLARDQEVTLFTLVLAGYAALLARITRQNDLLVGTPVADRGRPETEHLVGYFLNQLVLRLGVAGNDSFQELLARTRTLVHEAYAHQELPFGLLLDALKPERSLNRNPLFQVAFIFVMVLTSRSLEEVIEDGVFDAGTARVDLTLVAEDLPQEGIRAFWEYSTDLFDGTTIARLAGHFQSLLAAAVADPAGRVFDLPLLSAAERSALFLEWNDTAVPDLGGDCAHHLFVQQARRTPQAPAVVAPDGLLTYAELDRRSDHLAARLRRLHASPEVPVAVALERTVALPVALLGILKAGGAYVPLDPASPRERLAAILEDTGAAAVIAAEGTAAGLFAGGPPLPVIVPEDPDPELSATGLPEQLPVSAPGDLAYILFTSGSTGRPKGVEVTHAGLMNLLRAMQSLLRLGGEDRMLCVTSPSFDVSLMDLLLPFLTGATLVLASREETAEGQLLAARIAGDGITVLQATPGTWQMLVDCGWRGSPHLRALCGGEAPSQRLLGTLKERTGALWNVYGPTECSIWATIDRVDGAGPPSLGRPLAGTRVHLLDPGFQPVPVGVPGEICLGGLGVSRGYRRQPAQTGERFIPDPFTQGGRLYRTGDLGRRHPDGRVEFLGRIDHQVKVRGFRIELGEIETALQRHPSVSQAVAAARGEGPARQLVAYVTLAAETARPSVNDLRTFLREQLPEHMVPAILLILEAFPLTLHGKIDRRALPDPGEELAREQRAKAQAPRSILERQIAEIWQEILGLDAVSIHEPFFALGGTSLLTVRLHLRLQEVLGMDLKLVDLFYYPTIAALAEHVSQAAAGQVAASARLSPEEARRRSQENREWQRQRRTARRSGA